MSTEEQKIADLLKPRYKVIADYPNSMFNIGQILLQDDKDDTDFWTGDQLYTDRYPKNYPHLFKPLAWYEERPIKEMPLYLKVDGIIVKVQKYKDYKLSGLCFTDTMGNEDFISSAQPATQSEYEDYLTKVKL